MAPAVPYLIVGGLGYMQYQQQGAAGKYNQAVQNRNAEIAKQEAAQIDKQLESDLGRFDNQYTQLVGKTQVSIAKSGVSDEGTARRIARANAEQAEIQASNKTLADQILESPTELAKLKAALGL